MNQPEVPVPVRSRFSAWSRDPRKVIAAVLLVVAAAAGAWWGVRTYTKNGATDRSFRVTAAYPDAATMASPDVRIWVEFSKPVKAEDVARIAYSVPPRTFKGQQNSPAGIELIPDSPFAAGDSVFITIPADLRSAAGEMLAAEFKMNFSVALPAPVGEGVDFEARGGRWKVMSFVAGQPAAVTIAADSSKASPEISLYRATSSSVLVDDLMQGVGQQEPSYGYAGGSSGTNVFGSLVSRLGSPVQNFGTVAPGSDVSIAKDPGLYMLVASRGQQVVGRVWVSVGSFGVQLRRDDERLYLAAQSFGSQLPATMNARVFRFASGTAPVIQSRLGQDGTLSIPVRYPAVVDLVTVESGGEIAVMPMALGRQYWYSDVTRDLSDTFQTFVYLDRPLYKPGDTAYFRGVVRRDNDAQYSVPPVGTEVLVSGSSETQTVKTDRGGVFRGSFVVPPDAADADTGYRYPRYLTAQVNTPGSQTASVSFDVSLYKKPTFDLEASIQPGERYRGQQLDFGVRGFTFSGGVLANAEVKYSVYQQPLYESEKAVYSESFKIDPSSGGCGGGDFGDEAYYGTEIASSTVRLSAGGTGSVKFDTSKLPEQSSTVTLVVSRSDDRGNTITFAQSVDVYASGVLIFQQIPRGTYRPGDTLRVPVYAEDRSGQPASNRTVTLSVGRYEYKDGAYQVLENFGQSTVQTGSDGRATAAVPLKVALKDENGIALLVRASILDDQNRTVAAESTIYVTPETINEGDYTAQGTVLKVSSKQRTYQLGQEVSLSVEAPAAMDALLTFDRGRVYQPRWVHLNAGVNTVTVPVDAVFVPSITPTFSFFYKGEFYVEGLQLAVPAMGKVLSVDLVPNAERYSPGETAQVTIRTKDSKGNPVPADIGVAVVDRAIFALKKNTIRPLHSNFYYTRARSTDAVSSLSWINAYENGAEKGGGGGDEELKNVRNIDTLLWKSSLRTGLDGQLTVPVPVGNIPGTWTMVVYGSTDATDLGQDVLDLLVVK